MLAADNVSVPVPAGQGYTSLGLVKAGTQDLVLTLKQASAHQSLQVFTRDGRHLLGTDLNGPAGSPSTEGQAIIARIMKTANGMEAGAQYSEDQLNKTSDQRYLDMDLFMGVRAPIQFVQQFNPSTGALLEPKATPPVMQGRALGESVDWKSLIAQPGKFTLDGVALKPPAQTSNADPETLADWINSQNIPGVQASMVNGGLQLTRSDTAQDIRLGLGPNGTPADLGSIGFDTSVYVTGTAKDDLLVFVTDTTTGATSLDNANVTGQYASVSGDIKQMLREQSLQVTFTSDTSYEIRDTKTDTVLAERSLDSGAGVPTIHYRGLTLEFTTAPKSGDIFRVDGNQDGIGNNENMMNLIALEDKKVMPGNLTLTEAYIERVNQVGNVSRQASISKDALNVVFSQAKEARDSTSGVSLDEEASALVRFQQAYQANAKVMQMASQLFESILSVR